MKKNLLAMAAFLSMLGAIFSVGYAILQAVIAYHVEVNGAFHGEDYSLTTLFWLGAGGLLAALLAYLAALKIARIATRFEKKDQHPRSTIRD